MENEEITIFTIPVTRCKRCGGLLTSKFGLQNGMGHVCKQKSDKEVADEQFNKNQLKFEED